MGDTPRLEARPAPPQAPVHPVVAPTALSVDGGVVATSFTGDGSTLTNLNPDPQCYNLTQRFVDCGNGTVTDTRTGLIYLMDASCAGLFSFGTDIFGRGNYVQAQSAAASLSNGICGLTDGSRAGDWRLQTREEWEDILALSCLSAPLIVGNVVGISVGCYSQLGWASGVQSSDRYWSSSGHTQSLNSWQVNLQSGEVAGLPKTEVLYVWPVRGGLRSLDNG